MPASTTTSEIAWTIPVPAHERGLIRQWRGIGDPDECECWIGTTDDCTNVYAVRASLDEPGRWDCIHNRQIFDTQGTAGEARARCEGHARERVGE
jgi:hypothetical protein